MLIFNIFILIVYLTGPFCFYSKYLKEKIYSDACSSVKKENETCIYRKKIDEPLSAYDYKDILNLIWEKNIINKEKNIVVEYYLSKPYNKYTYDDIYNKVLGFSYSLNNYKGGIPLKLYDEEKNNGKFRLLGIYGANSANWIISDLASMISGITTVIIHSKFHIDEIINILNTTKLEWLCIDINLAENLLNYKDKLSNLKYFIILDSLAKFSNEIEFSHKGTKENKKVNIEINDSFSEHIRTKLMKLEKLKVIAGKVGIEIIDFDDMVSNNIENITIYNESADFVTTIVYTSGTSGNSKGVMLTNQNFFYTIMPLSSNRFFSSDKENHFSYLPLSHIYERVNVLLSLLNGLVVHIWSKEILNYSKDLITIQPNFLIGVPRIYTEILSNIKKEIQKLSKFKRFFVRKVLKFRIYFNNGRFSRFLESITRISKKIREKVNPKLLFMINGGGSLSPTIQKELHIILGARIYQGYGLTETTGPIFLQHADDANYNSIGSPTSEHSEFKLVSWEKYTVNDNIPKGELLIKGKQIFCGYFLKKEDTKEAFTTDKFFKTGDIVQINSNGSLTFLDRSKGLIKLSQGEYIETERLNNIYSEIIFINYCIVYGDETLNRPIAIISLDINSFAKSLLEDNILNDKRITEEDILNFEDDDFNSPIFVNYVKNKMFEMHGKYKLSRLNKIDDIYLTAKVWNTENYITPTLKVKRFKVFIDYAFFIKKAKGNKIKEKI